MLGLDIHILSFQIQDKVCKEKRCLRGDTQWLQSLQKVIKAKRLAFF